MIACTHERCQWLWEAALGVEEQHTLGLARLVDVVAGWEALARRCDPSCPHWPEIQEKLGLYREACE